MCNLFDVSPAGFYEWRGRAPSARACSDAVLRGEIVDIHEDSRRTYGRPRIHAELADRGVRVGAKRVARLMQSAKIQGVRRRRFVRTTNSQHDQPIAPNILERTFDPSAIGDINRVWAGDITYVPTREGWLYLAVVLDLGSRRVVGWSMSDSMRDELVIAALDAATKARKPSKPLLFHSDRGSQYASRAYRALTRRRGIIQSMSRKGDCWDNAAVESFFGTLKAELRDPIWDTRSAARTAIFDYIETWYNRRRRHSTLGYVSPMQYESSLPIAA
jgi:transposase InsO family protein